MSVDISKLMLIGKIHDEDNIDRILFSYTVPIPEAMSHIVIEFRLVDGMLGRCTVALVPEGKSTFGSRTSYMWGEVHSIDPKSSTVRAMFDKAHNVDPKSSFDKWLFEWFMAAVHHALALLASEQDRMRQTQIQDESIIKKIDRIVL